ncbi:acetylglutamate kinase [Streptococcus dentasini]
MSNTIVVKIGGQASQRLDEAFIKQVQEWIRADKSLVIVHGGGYMISQLMEQAQIPIETVDGLRVTPARAMPLVEAGLIDYVGKHLADSLTQSGLMVKQIVDHLPQLVEADFLDKSKYGYVGQVTKVHVHILEGVLATGAIPLVPSLGYQLDGSSLNINADYLATSIAIALQAEKLILLTDVPGIKEEGQLLDTLLTNDIQEKVAHNVITGGMIPKVQSAAKTVAAGVAQVMIGDNLTKGTIIKES